VTRRVCRALAALSGGAVGLIRNTLESCSALASWPRAAHVRLASELGRPHGPLELVGDDMAPVWQGAQTPTIGRWS
jgi:hypothetical protein